MQRPGHARKDPDLPHSSQPFSMSWLLALRLLPHDQKVAVAVPNAFPAHEDLQGRRKETERFQRILSHLVS